MRFRSFGTFLGLAAGVLFTVALARQAHAQWDLVWSDEFDRTTMAGSDWEAQIGTGTLYGLPPGWGNDELQYYTDRPQNLFVDGDHLHIVARAESYAGSSYTSARLRTLGEFDVLYGRVEARIKLPAFAGGWPAFWMLPSTDKYGGWAAGGEIDIMEARNAADRIFGTTHFGDEWPGNTYAGGQYASASIPTFSNDFHVYAVEWEPTEIRWYVDGVEYYSLPSGFWWSAGAPDNPLAPFDRPFHLLLNVAVGGHFPGSPNGSAGFPAEMVVDYVRVYQAEGQAAYTSDANPHPVPGTIEAEDYDLGGPGVAYFDDDPSNNGGVYRPGEGVDIEPSSGGGFNIGWLREDEWIEYTVDIQSAGAYELTARVASQSTGGSFRFEVDHEPVGAPLSFASTGGWQSWIEVSAAVDLPAGEHVLRFRNTSPPGDEFNVDWFRFCPVAPEGDANGDGAVDSGDISYVVFRLGGSGNPGEVDGDANADGVVDVNDIAYVVFRLGNTCP